MDSCSRLTAKTLEETGTAAQTQSVSAATTMKNALRDVTSRRCLAGTGGGFTGEWIVARIL